MVPDGVSTARVQSIPLSGGALLRIIAIGPDTGEPLIVLHGGPGESHGYLRPHLDRLVEERRQVVYYDQRGSGESVVPAGAPQAGWREHVADLEELRKHLKVERACLLGFSWGALLALLYAMEHRDRVQRLVLVSSPPLWKEAKFAAGSGAAADSSSSALSSLRATLEPIARDANDPEAAWRAQFALRVAPALADPSTVFELSPVRRVDAAAQAVWRSLGRFDLRAGAERLRGIPALVLHGDKDSIPISTAFDTAAHLGGRAMILQDCGHVPFVGRSKDVFTEAVKNFLNER